MYGMDMEYILNNIIEGIKKTLYEISNKKVNISIFSDVILEDKAKVIYYSFEAENYKVVIVFKIEDVKKLLKMISNREIDVNSFEGRILLEDFRKKLFAVLSKEMNIKDGQSKYIISTANRITTGDLRFKISIKLNGDIVDGFIYFSPKFVKTIDKTNVGILEEGKEYKIFKKPGENVVYYYVKLPELNEYEKNLIRRIKLAAIREINIDPEKIKDREKRKKIFKDAIIKLIETEFPEVDKKEVFAEIIARDMVSYSILDPLIEDDNLEEVMVIGVNKPVYVYHRKYGMCKTNVVFENEDDLVSLIMRIASSIGRRIDYTSPLLDARLPNGDRVNATVRPISLDGPTLTIRKFKKNPLTVVDLIRFGTMSTDVAAFLWLAVEGFGVKPANILISGGTSSGKTTTLNCLATFIPQNERVITIEDTAELKLPLKHWIRLETRPPNVEGKGEVNMYTLLKNTLRMRPDRVIVGEVRGEEAKTLFTAMNTGLSGCMGTLHANTAKETIIRLTTSPMNVPIKMIPALDFIVVQGRMRYKGKAIRRIIEIAEIEGIEGNEVKMRTIFKWNAKEDRLEFTGEDSRYLEEISRLKGVTIAEIEEELKERREFLEYLLKNNINTVKEIGREINKFYLKKRKRKGVAEIGEKYRIVYEDSIPKYIIDLPDFDKKRIKDIELKVIDEIKIDPSAFPKEKLEKVFEKEIMKLLRNERINEKEKKKVAELVTYRLLGYGEIEYFLNDDNLEEVMIIGVNKPVYVNHKIYGMCETNVVFDDEEDILRIIERIANVVGRRIDVSVPLLDGKLPNGDRVNATVRPISLDGPTLTIRKFRKKPLTFIDLIKNRTINVEATAFLWLAVEGFGVKPANIIVAGGSSTGKTTFLNCLATFIPQNERVITIEDTAELNLPLDHCIRLETRPPSVEGVGEVTMDDLVKNTLRMRPDRIIVGEVRGEEARTLFTAMNTGHSGCMGTLHANSAKETIIRLTTPPMNVPESMITSLDLIVMMEKIKKNDVTLRKITEIAEVVKIGEKIDVNVIYKWDPREDTLKRINKSNIEEKLAESGGMSIEEFYEELENRKTALRYMVSNVKNDLRSVIEFVNSYYVNKEKIIKEAEKALWQG